MHWRQLTKDYKISLGRLDSIICMNEMHCGDVVGPIHKVQLRHVCDNFVKVAEHNFSMVWKIILWSATVSSLIALA